MRIISGSLKSKLSKLLIASLLIVPFSVAPQFETTVLAAGTTYYVDTNGSDSNDGTSLSTPFKSIQQAASIATSGDTVLIRGGTYRETVTPANSGTSGNIITYQNYNGETVVVSGSDLITGWTQDSGNIYKAPMNWSLGAGNQVFVNGSMMDEARWPNQTGTILSPTRATTDAGTNAAQVIDAALPGGINFTGATMWIQSGSGWIVQTPNITAYDSVAKKLTLGPLRVPSGVYTPASGDPYYLSGIKGALDTTNEWWYDSANSELYLWAPSGADPSTLTVDAKRRSNSFDLSGKAHITINGIQTIASTIMTDSLSNHITLQNIVAKYLSHNKLNTLALEQVNLGFTLDGNNNVLRDSELAYSSGSLITVKGSNNNVINNYIHHGGYVPDWDGLVNLKGANSLISHNTVADAGRVTIYFSTGMSANNIQYNDVYNAGWLSDDLGMLYGPNTDGQNTEIHHNYVHDNKATATRAGIYLDNYTNNFIIHHNVLWNNSGFQINIPSEYNLIYNNTAWTGTGSVGAWGNIFTNDLFGDRFFNNIIKGLDADVTAYTAYGSNLTSNPGFVNEASRDYRLESTSPAKDTGIVIPGITDGHVGSAPDIGAYEYGGTDWTAGHNFASPPSPTNTRTSTPFMNKVVNGGFEYGDLSSWSTTDAGNAVVMADGHWGKAANAGMSRSQAYGLKLSGGTDGVAQTITGLQPNTNYIVGGWLRSPAGATAALGVKDFGSAEMTSTSTSSTWTFNTINFRTGPTNTSATIFFKKTSATGEAYFDDAGLILDVKQPAPGNIANLATITASSQFSSAFVPSYVADDLAGQSTGEWASSGELNPWIQLTWNGTVTIDSINLYDRITAAANVNSGTLTFSDGSSIDVTGILNDIPKTVTFPTKSVTWVKFQVTGGTGTNNGLSEFQVFGSNPNAITVTASSQYNAQFAPSKVVDGSTVNEWASLGEQNPWVQLTWAQPRTVAEIILYDRANTTDNTNGGTLTFSDGSSVTVTGIPTNGSAKYVQFPTKTVTGVKFQVAGGSGPNVGLAEIKLNELPTPGIYQNMYSFDSFESGLSNWKTVYGSPSLSSAQTHSGSNSYLINQDQDAIQQVFDTSYNKVVSMWFYDTATANNWQIGAWVDDGIDPRGIFVNTPTSTTKYSIRVGGTYTATSVTRTTGWHEFKFDYTSGTKLDMYIDGVLVGSPTGVTSFNRISIGDFWTPNTVAGYFDDISIMDLPAAPIQNSIAAGNGKLTLNWTSIPKSTGYKVKYGTASGIYTTTVPVGDVRSTTIEGLQNGTTYYFAVSAYNSAGESRNSNEAIGTPDGIAPLDAVLSADITEPTNSDVTVTINYPSDATVKEYKVGDNGAWTAYGAPVVISENSTVYARGTDDAGNMSNEASCTVSNIDHIAPTLKVSDSNSTTAYLGATYTDAGATATDNVDGDVTSSIVTTGTVDTSKEGTYSITYSVQDHVGNIAIATRTVQVINVYKFSGILNPINLNGSSVFKQGSTVPVKFQLMDALNQYVTNLSASIKVTYLSADVDGTDIEDVISTDASTGTLFRYDSTANQYIFNLSTKTLEVGKYQVEVVLPSTYTLVSTTLLKITFSLRSK